MRSLHIFTLLLLGSFASASYAQSNTQDTQSTIEQAEVNALNKLQSQLTREKPQTTPENQTSQNQNVTPPAATPPPVNAQTPSKDPAASNAPTKPSNPWEKPNPWAEQAKTNPWANRPMPPAPNADSAATPQNQSSSSLPLPPNIFSPAQPPVAAKPTAPQTAPAQQPAAAPSNSSTPSSNP